MSDDLSGFACFAAFMWLLAASMASQIGAARGRTWDGFLFGIVLGPIGVICASLLRPTPEVEARHRAEVEQLLPRYRADLEAAGVQHAKKLARQRKQLDAEQATKEARDEAEQHHKITCPTCSADLYPAAGVAEITCGVCGASVRAAAT